MELQWAISRRRGSAAHLPPQTPVTLVTTDGLSPTVEDGSLTQLDASQGLPVDVVEAVLSVQFDDLVDARARVEAVARFRGSPEFEPLTVAFKRVVNILKGVQYNNKVDPARFETPQEKALHERYGKIAGRFSELITEGSYEKALAALAELRPPVDSLFDNVMVMAEDKKVRANRLALLGEIAALFSQMADFSQLGVGEEGY